MNLSSFNKIPVYSAKPNKSNKEFIELTNKLIRVSYQNSIQNMKSHIEKRLGGKILFKTTDIKIRQTYNHICKNPQFSKKRILNSLI